MHVHCCLDSRQPLSFHTLSTLPKQAIVLLLLSLLLSLSLVLLFDVCSDIILGSEGGALHTTNQDSRSKREGPSSLLLDFKDKAK